MEPGHRNVVNLGLFLLWGWQWPPSKSWMRFPSRGSIVTRWFQKLHLWHKTFREELSPAPQSEFQHFPVNAQSQTHNAVRVFGRSSSTQSSSRLSPCSSTFFEGSVWFHLNFRSFPGANPDDEFPQGVSTSGATPKASRPRPKVAALLDPEMADAKAEVEAEARTRRQELQRFAEDALKTQDHVTKTALEEVKVIDLRLAELEEEWTRLKEQRSQIATRHLNEKDSIQELEEHLLRYADMFHHLESLPVAQEVRELDFRFALERRRALVQSTERVIHKNLQQWQRMVRPGNPVIQEMLERWLPPVATCSRRSDPQPPVQSHKVAPAQTASGDGVSAPPKTASIEGASAQSTSPAKATPGDAAVSESSGSGADPSAFQRETTTAASAPDSGDSAEGAAAALTAAWRTLEEDATTAAPPTASSAADEKATLAPPAEACGVEEAPEDASEESFDSCPDLVEILDEWQLV